MKLIGLTGGIGSGKSTVAYLFKLLGIPVYDSDERAKKLMLEDHVMKAIINLFGHSAYHDDGTLNNTWIASRVFNDKEALEKLNAIVHPAVFNDLQAWVQQYEDASPYLIQESAIIFEEDLTGRFDAIIIVAANEAERIHRVMERDNTTEEKTRARMVHQWDDNRKISFADYVIYNDGGRSLINQVKDIDAMIKSAL